MDVIKSVKHLPTHEVKQFITNMHENIKELHTKEVKHCDSLIYELELICELDLEYIMCPTDPYVYKAICSEEKWHRSTCLIPAFSSENYAIQPIKHKEYHWKGWRYNQNYCRLFGDEKGSCGNPQICHQGRSAK